MGDGFFTRCETFTDFDTTKYIKNDKLSRINIKILRFIIGFHREFANTE